MCSKRYTPAFEATSLGFSDTWGKRISRVSQGYRQVCRPTLRTLGLLPDEFAALGEMGRTR